MGRQQEQTHDTTTASLVQLVRGSGNFKDVVEDRVNEQYDTDASMAFYEYVMGGGGDDIHYGIFRTGKEDLKESSQNSVNLLAKLGEEAGVLVKGGARGSVRVLDLGSGKGGAARWLAREYGCHVTCFNLGENQNKLNMRKAAQQGVGDLITTTAGSFNDALPMEWTDNFDMVWSQEAFCHCMDQTSLMSEIQRVLKPGGSVVFTDIMQGDNGGDCSSFTGQNVTAKLATPQMYKDAIAAAGMKLSKHHDLTHHLTQYFKCMLRVVKECRLPMQLRGVPPSRLDAYEEDLVTRFDGVKQRAFAWGAFSATNLFSSDALVNGALDLGPDGADKLEQVVNEQYDTESAMSFYKYAMGGGSDNVHYGVFTKGDEDLKTASHNSVLLLAELARRISPLGLGFGSKVKVLDLGSGKGGAARYLAKTFGCSVVCYNLGANQNRHNLAMARAEGLEHLISCKQGNFNGGLPAEWTAMFDLVWSQEALCHAVNQKSVLDEIQRVLKPGGSAVFTDIMRVMPSMQNMQALAASADLSDGSADISDNDTTTQASDASAGSSPPTNATPHPRTAHFTSPNRYMADARDVGLDFIRFRDLTRYLSPFFRCMLAEIDAHERDMLSEGVPPRRLNALRVDLQNRLRAVETGALSWGVFTVRKPSISRALVVGGGPVGAYLAMRMSQSGVSNVTLKTLPTVKREVVEMVELAGVATADDWCELQDSQWGSILIAVKTHWLPEIALEMQSASISWESLCLVYNGYAVTPQFFRGLKCCRAVVPQSFSFDAEPQIAWDLKHGNAHNPWSFPMDKCAASVVGQLKQSGVNARCFSNFHKSAFFKFCVNNAANLLSVIKKKNCEQLCADASAVEMMRAILHESFNVLELDSFFAAIVPMHRSEFIEDVIFRSPSSVASYKTHFPSSYQHYAQGKLVDTRALNGFIVRKAREVNASAPINEFVARQVVAISEATCHGVPREEWDARVTLSAAKRLTERLGLGNSVWGHATVRNPTNADTMLLAPFGEAFGAARASNVAAVPLHPEQLPEADRKRFNITAIVLHGAVYSGRPDVGCVLHTHSPHATAMACSEAKFNAEVMQDAMQFAGRVAYHEFGGVADECEEMALVADAAKDADVVFLKNHGVLVLGPDAETAFSRLYYLERSCQVQLLVTASGTSMAKPGQAGVKHTVDWYTAEGRESAHAEWSSHVSELLSMEATSSRTRPFWYE